MIKYILLSALLVLGFTTTKAQLTVSNSLTPQQLVNNVLLGNGVTAFNITYTGAAQAIGTFNSTNSNVGLGSGILMCSGNVNLAVGPNTATGQGEINGQPGDSDIDQFDLTSQSEDAATLEFDFIPSSDSISFRYVFASEEYEDFSAGPNFTFTDAFGFFLSGPGINGQFSNNSENVALLPGTSLPVSIANVNQNVNNQYYIPNLSPGEGGNPPPNNFAYDGYTVVLTAHANVICGDTFHIKISIADRSDGSYDSGVFLEAESFASGGLAVSTQTLSGDSIVSEGCIGAGYVFSRVDTSTTDTIVLVIGGNAIAGVDYLPISDTIIFPQGEDSIIIQITTLQDGIFEGTDTLTATVSFVTECGNTVIRQGVLYIVDTVLISTAPDTFIVQCNTDSFFVTVTPQNGNPPFVYDWSTGDIDDTIWLHAVQDTFVTVQITDTCGNTSGIDTVYVHFQLLPPLTLDLITGLLSDTLTCDNNFIFPEANVTGGLMGPNGYTYLWSDGEINPFPFYFIDSTQFLWVEVQDLCGTTLRDSVLITYLTPPLPQINLTREDTIISCPFIGGLTIGANVTYIGGVLDYNWNVGLSGFGVTSINPLVVNPINTTTYFVSVSECNRVTNSDTVTITVIVPDPPTVAINGIQPVQCLGDSVYLTAEFTGGTPPLSYFWTGVSGATQNINAIVTIANTLGAQVQLNVTDACHTTPVLVTNIVPYQAPAPINIALSDTTVHCLGDTITLFTSVTGGGIPLKYIDWDSETGLVNDSFSLVTVNSDTIFHITVKDQCDTTRSDSVKVTVSAFPDISVSVNADSAYCATDSVNFKGTASGGDGNLITEWWANGTLVNNELIFSDTFGSPDTTNYILKVTDGCLTTATDTFKVIIKSCEIEVTNFISPNGDGINDLLIFPNAQYYPENTLQVYDRWGRRVFNSTNYKNDWNGGKLNDGSYFYVLTPTTTPQGPFKGFFELIRDK